MRGVVSLCIVYIVLRMSYRLYVDKKWFYLRIVFQRNYIPDGGWKLTEA
jgi:hypothetical protein